MINKVHLSFSLLAITYCYFLNPGAHSQINSKTEFLSSQKQQPTAFQKSIANGKELYNELCIQCHMDNGKGNGMIIPPLDGSDWLKKRITESIHAIKYGQKGEIIVNGKKFNNIMPSPGLSNEEIADVMNYISNSWTNKSKKMITVKDVIAVKP